MKKKSLVVTALAATLLLTGLSASRVYGARAIDFTQAASITVGLSDTNQYEELTENEIHVTFTQIASMDENGEYTSDYIDVKNITDSTTAASWIAMAEEAAGKDLKGAYQTTVVMTDGNTATARIPGEHFGLYLMQVDAFETEEYSYTFANAIVAVPGNNYYSYDADGNPVAGEDDAWIYQVSTVLKPEYDTLTGDVTIHKSLDTYNMSLSETSFVFKVTAYKDYSAVDRELGRQLVYSNLATLTFNEAGADELTIEGIPAGAEVTIEEVYSGATYKLVSDRVQNVVIDNHETAVVTFENTYDDTLEGNGTAIVNTFYYMKNNDGVTGSWNWTNYLNY